MAEHAPRAELEADLAFSAANRRRRWAALLGRATRGLPVYDETAHRQPGPPGVTEIPLEAIAGTTEPNRAEQFDGQFRPEPIARGRLERVWMAVQRGVSLPPISVVRIGDANAIHDGHHRVSVAKALGARTIAARVI